MRPARRLDHGSWPASAVIEVVVARIGVGLHDESDDPAAA